MQTAILKLQEFGEYSRLVLCLFIVFDDSSLETARQNLPSAGGAKRDPRAGPLFDFPGLVEVFAVSTKMGFGRRAFVFDICFA